MGIDEDVDQISDAADEAETGESHETAEGGKPPRIEIIARADADGVERPEYAMLDELVARCHPKLAKAGARIVLAWRSGWTPDRDGRLQLGKAQKASDLNRKLHGYDFVILLNREVWCEQPEFSAAQRRALLDHELTHCDVELDDVGQPAMDKSGRPKWRIRKHDIEEFGEVVQRNGLWINSLEAFAAVLAQNKAAL